MLPELLPKNSRIQIAASQESLRYLPLGYVHLLRFQRST